MKALRKWQKCESTAGFVAQLAIIMRAATGLGTNGAVQN
jgi:hypothetical protein